MPREKFSASESQQKDQNPHGKHLRDRWRGRPRGKVVTLEDQVDQHHRDGQGISTFVGGMTSGPRRGTTTYERDPQTGEMIEQRGPDAQMIQDIGDGAQRGWNRVKTIWTAKNPVTALLNEVFNIADGDYRKEKRERKARKKWKEAKTFSKVPLSGSGTFSWNPLRRSWGRSKALDRKIWKDRLTRYLDDPTEQEQPDSHYVIDLERHGYKNKPENREYWQRKERKMNKNSPEGQREENYRDWRRKRREREDGATREPEKEQETPEPETPVVPANEDTQKPDTPGTSDRDQAAQELKDLLTQKLVEELFRAQQEKREREAQEADERAQEEASRREQEKAADEVIDAEIVDEGPKSAPEKRSDEPDDVVDAEIVDPDELVVDLSDRLERPEAGGSDYTNDDVRDHEHPSGYPEIMLDEQLALPPGRGGPEKTKQEDKDER